MSVKRIDLEFHGFLGLCTGSCWLRFIWRASGHWRCLGKIFSWGCQQPCLERRKPEQTPPPNSSGRKLHQPTARNDVTEELVSFCRRLQRNLGYPKGLKVLGQWEVLLQSLCEGHPWLLASKRRKSSPELIDLQDMLIAECWLTKTQFWLNKRMFNWVCRKNDADHHFLMQTVCVYFRISIYIDDN